MQDWEYEVATPEVFASLLALYQNGGLDEDERFSAGMIFVQIVADLAEEQGQLPREWSIVSELLQSEPRLHAATIAYWAEFGFGHDHEWVLVGTEMRSLWPVISQALTSDA